MLVSERINNILKWVNSVNNGARETNFGLFGGGGDDEYRGIGLVEISKAFETQDHCFHGMMLFDREYHDRSFSLI